MVLHDRPGYLKLTLKFGQKPNFWAKQIAEKPNIRTNIMQKKVISGLESEQNPYSGLKSRRSPTYIPTYT
jgi:hypothetical protein